MRHAYAATLLILLAFNSSAAEPTRLAPRVVTQAVRYDTDDPAIWINPVDPAASLVLGTDKNKDGALYVFDLAGKIVQDKVVRGLARPNNVDVTYHVSVGGKPVDIVVVTERLAHRLRIFRLPDMAPIDGGGIPVFEGERARDAMGIAMYTRASDGAVFAIVSRSDEFAPKDGYLHQYRLVDDGNGNLRGIFTRAFGSWNGGKEIEAITVDNELGYIYYSDENYGIHKYQADPLAKDADKQLAEFGRSDFTNDQEGLSVYKRADGTGYLLASDQQADQFNIYAREGTAGAPHEHKLLARVKLSTHESDGSDITTAAVPGFAGGLFVAMSTDKTFQYYAVADVLRAAGLRP